MSSLVIAIDPGTKQSAILKWDGIAVTDPAILENENCLARVRLMEKPALIAVEMVACYGMSVGHEVFETCLIVGRLQEIASNRGIPFRLVYRREVKMHLCGTMKAKDPNIRQALIDKFGQVGTKKQPGKLYGVSSHLWAALGVAVVAIETEEAVK